MSPKTDKKAIEQEQAQLLVFQDAIKTELENLKQFETMLIKNNSRPLSRVFSFFLHKNRTLIKQTQELSNSLHAIDRALNNLKEELAHLQDTDAFLDYQIKLKKELTEANSHYISTKKDHPFLRQIGEKIKGNFNHLLNQPLFLSKNRLREDK